MRHLPILFLVAVLGLADRPLSAAEKSAPGNSEPAAKTIKNVSVAEAEKLVNDRKVTVLDVRTPEEFAKGHIAGATNINFNGKNFEKQIAALDKSRPYLVHCAAGGRSSKALDKMKTLDFKSVYHMHEGFKAWEKAEKPVEK